MERVYTSTRLPIYLIHSQGFFVFPQTHSIAHLLYQGSPKIVILPLLDNMETVHFSSVYIVPQILIIIGCPSQHLVGIFFLFRLSHVKHLKHIRDARN